MSHRSTFSNLLFRFIPSVPPNFQEELETYTEQGYRVIGLAYKPLDKKFTWHQAQRVERYVNTMIDIVIMITMIIIIINITIASITTVISIIIIIIIHHTCGKVYK